MSTLTRNRWMIVIVLILVSATVQMVSAETAHVANHVVISEVFYAEISTDKNEFIEIYNPTSIDVSLNSWTLTHHRQDGDQQWSITFGDTDIIPSHGFYLVGQKDPLNSSDWGGNEISPDKISGKTLQNGPDDYLVLKDDDGNYVDGVRWGHQDDNNPPGILDVPDNNTAPNPEAGKSIERKAINSSTPSSMASGGAYYTWGNAEDTNNNSADFITKTTPEPQNSSSATEDSPSQSWFLSNTSGSDYIMYKGDMSKSEGTITLAAGQPKLWQPDETAQVDVGFPAGTWDGTITFDPAPASGQDFDVEVGIYEDGNGGFSSKGSESFTGDGTTTSFQLNIVASAFTVTEGDYFYLRITNNGTVNLIVKTGGGNSYVTSPPSDPGYPVPELATIVLVSAGLLILAGYAYMGKRSK